VRRPVTVAVIVTGLCATVALPAALPAALSGAAAASSRVAHAKPKSAAAIYLVGGARRSINPSAAMLAGKNFYLGGYGITDFKVANQEQIPGTTGRYATGILGDGAHSHAMMVSDRKRTIALAEIETQGYFASYKQGPFGIEEIRRDAAAKIAKLASHEAHPAPVPDAAEILVDSDHTHGGADTVGVWGGVPTSYLRLVHDRTVAALVAAWRRMRPATLTYGVAHAGVESEEKAYPPTGGTDPLLTNQFSTDPNNQVMDDEVRVLQAHDPATNRVIGTYVNYSSHPTVLGSDNTLVTGDYVGRLNLKIAKAYGGFGFDQVGTLGRTQPARTGCTIAGLKGARESLCELDQYAARVMVKIRAAVKAAKPVRGPAVVAMSSYLMTDPATSPTLISLVYGGTVVGAPAARTVGAPWFTGDVLGTTAFSGRIGSLLISGGPGEMYPQIVAKVRHTVKGMQGYLNIGTAGDFLGYLIAPLGAYPEPVRRSMFSGDPPPAGDPQCAAGGVSVGCPDPVGNDNYFFNVSHTIGLRLTCALLRGAADQLGKPATTYTRTDSTCAAFANDLALPPGEDTTFPPQPDRSAEFPHM
jgi:hypothetical protein